MGSDRREYQREYMRRYREKHPAKYKRRKVMSMPRHMRGYPPRTALFDRYNIKCDELSSLFLTQITTHVRCVAIVLQKVLAENNSKQMWHAILFAQQLVMKLAVNRREAASKVQGLSHPEALGDWRVRRHAPCGPSRAP